MKTTISISRIALVISILFGALGHTAASAQTITITLKNGTIKSYSLTAIDSIRYVGGEWQSENGIGVKIYRNGSTASEDYLYSQMSSFVVTGDVAAPVINPNGGTISSATTVTISASNGATIYYTTDGSYPGSSGTAHTGTTSVTITVNHTTTVRAMALLNGIWSDETAAVFTYTGSITDDNENANWHETNYNIPESATNATSSSATYGMAWRLEYPHISTDANSMVVVHATSLGISLSFELDKSQRANRWTCFTMHPGIPNNNVGRSSSTFSVDECVPASAQVTHNEYTTGKYTTSCTNLDGSNMTLFARGHICASEDRQTTTEQNKHTFITSNIHPQYQAHNAGLWSRMESKVQGWGYNNSFRDTLYVCKGATIADVTLNGSASSGTIPNTEVYSKFGVNITGSLTIPRYWYMAVLRLKNGEYEAMAYWTEHINSSCSSTTLESCIITIDELERRTGIDFFCNLPDDIEAAVEAVVNSNIWQ